MTQSKEYPTVQKRGNLISVPLGIHDVSISLDDGRTETHYEYDLIHAESPYGGYDVDFIRGVCLDWIREQARSQIESAYPWWYQVNCADGTYGSETADAVLAGKAAIIAESNRCEDLAYAAVAIADLIQIQPSWPEV